MGAKDNHTSRGNLLNFINEDDTSGFQLTHHVDVVHNLFADIYRCAVALECFFYRYDGSVNACTIPTGGSK